MKKLFSATAAMLLAISLVSCATSSDGPQKVEQSSSVSGDTTNVSSEESFAIGDLVKVNDWEISIDGIEWKDKIGDSEFLNFTPDEGNQFAEITMTVKNTGKESASFLPTVTLEDTSIKILYDGQYEYSASNLLGYSNDLHDKSLNPLTSVSGSIAFDVPSEVASSDKSLVLVLTDDGTEMKVKLR